MTGALLGAGFGAIVGKKIADGIDPDEDHLWQNRFREELDDEADDEFDDYGPAYQLGRRRYIPNTALDAEEETFCRDWEPDRGASRLDGSQARHAANASWIRAGLENFPEDRATPKFVFRLSTLTGIRCPSWK